MGRRVVALALALVGCRGEPAPESPPAEPSSAKAEVPPAEPSEPEVAEEEPRTSEPEVDEPTPDKATPTGPALTSGAVVADLQKRWPTFSAAHLADNASRKTLDGLVADGKPSVTTKSCTDAAKAAQAFLDNGNDLLYGEVATVTGRSGNCWALHIPGLMGPSLELVLREDGEVLIAVMILEG